MVRREPPAEAQQRAGRARDCTIARGVLGRRMAGRRQRCSRPCPRRGLFEALAMEDALAVLAAALNNKGVQVSVTGQTHASAQRESLDRSEETMGYKTIRMLSVITLFMAASFMLVRGVETIGLLKEGAADWVLLPVGLVCLFLGQLAHTVGSILEKQADEISELRRQLADSGATG